VKKGERIVYVILVLAGAVSLFLSVFIYSRAMRFVANGTETQAEITSIETHYSGEDTEYDVFVKFTVDGTVYGGRLDVYEAGFYVGKTVPILYLNDNPNEFIYARHNLLIAYILFLLGVIFISVVTVPIITRAVRKGKIKRYTLGGKTYCVRVSAVEKAYKFNFFGKYVFNVLGFDGEGRLYEKKMLLASGAVEVGDVITVYVDGEDQDKFIFDTSSVAKKQ